MYLGSVYAIRIHMNISSCGRSTYLVRIVVARSKMETFDKNEEDGFTIWMTVGSVPITTNQWDTFGLTFSAECEDSRLSLHFWPPLFFGTDQKSLSFQTRRKPVNPNDLRSSRVRLLLVAVLSTTDSSASHV